jgi:AcrR family transcriptional regulator
MSKTLATDTKSRERGRPREFDIELALDKAMLVFRQKGFHAASLNDLGEAMGLTSGSIYKAFKDKRSMFLLVFERYLSMRNADLRQRLAPFTTGREKLSELLQFYLDSARAVEGRTGCLVVGSTVELQVLDDDLSQLVSEAVIRNKNFIASLLRLGQEDGSVTQNLAIDTASELILCIAFGMRVVGKITDVKDEPEIIKLVMKLLD